MFNFYFICDEKEQLKQQIKDLGFTITSNFFDYNSKYHTRFRNYKGDLFDIVDGKPDTVLPNSYDINKLTLEEINVLSQYNSLKRKEHIQWLKNIGKTNIIKKYNLEGE